VVLGESGLMTVYAINKITAPLTLPGKAQAA
jgi:hypothetical protein